MPPAVRPFDIHRPRRVAWKPNGERRPGECRTGPRCGMPADLDGDPVRV